MMDQSSIVKDGLLIYYNGKSGEQQTSILHDLSGNNNHADIYGATLQSDGTFYMDGVDDYFHLPDISGLTNYTIEFWVNRAAGNNNVLAFGSTDNYIRIDTESNGFTNIRVAQSGQSRSGNHSNADTTGIMSHYAVSYNVEEKEAYRYLNGEVLSELSFINDMNFSIRGTLGRASTSSSSSMLKGYLGLLRIYNRNLSYEELMHNRAIGLEVGLEKNNTKYFNNVTNQWETVKAKTFIDEQWKTIRPLYHDVEWK